MLNCNTDGLWKNNPGFVQLLGLCPLLAVSTTLANALALGLATTFVLISSNTLIGLLGRFILPHLRMPIFVLIIASFVTVVQLLLSAYRFELYQSLGIFLALITTNCVIMGRAESFAYKNPPLSGAIDGLIQGIGFSIALLMLGGIRELLGHGTLFSGFSDLFHSADLTWHALPQGSGFILALLPPGAFFIMGFIIAFKNWMNTR